MQSGEVKVTIDTEKLNVQYPDKDGHRELANNPLGVATQNEKLEGSTGDSLSINRAHYKPRFDFSLLGSTEIIGMF